MAALKEKVAELAAEVEKKEQDASSSAEEVAALKKEKEKVEQKVEEAEKRWRSWRRLWGL